MNTTYLGLLLLLSAIWGASFMLIKIGVGEIGPLTFATLRVLIGSLSLAVALRVTRQKAPTSPRIWRRFAVMGALGITIPFGAISWGTQYIASGLSAILNAAMPLFTVILAAVWGDEKFTLKRVLGVLLGFGGIVVLTWPKLQGGLGASVWGELAIVLAALAYAVAIVYARHHLTGQAPIVASFGQVTMGCLLFIPFTLAFEQPFAVMPSLKVIGALLAIGVLGTGVAYIIYYRLLSGLGATGTSLVTYVVPVFGIFWGWAILNERLGWHAFAALGMILVGLLLVNNLPLRKR